MVVQYYKHHVCYAWQSYLRYDSQTLWEGENLKA